MLDGERDFSAGQQGIPPVGHEDSARMTAHARELDAECGGCGDFFDNADWNAGFFQKRTLFDVEFDESGVAVFCETNRLQTILQTRTLAPISEIAAIAITQLGGFR